ncbi:hypothetical protein ACWOC1_12630 [Enterococcus quebecensis]|uniref:Uncharacterized protein n=1 Tax=Enterococcus quebecensis TaxID=903983 RepID=A0A1E5H2V0_9ENTE|nr:hypothetical protein [Enterococcus quebecensis]OEG19269.1 hypothetical protein BCR23_00850 [Enterococcus quebecensis]OJG75817.1 hypothetical protein RV12_GL000156 [Enterococcus quebecensis]
MTLLDWIAVISLAVAILFLLFVLLLFVGIFKTGKEQKKLFSIRTKNKRKRKMIARKKRGLQKKKKKCIWGSVLCFIMMFLGAGTSMYVVYYQSTNLSESDKKSIVSGYYNLRDIEEQLNLAESGDGQRAEQNLKNLSLRLAAFALNKADYRISGDGQVCINRYYSSMKELGINLSSQEKEFYKDSTLTESFKNDIEKVKKNEKAVIDQFKINERSLAAKK